MQGEEHTSNSLSAPRHTNRKYKIENRKLLTKCCPTVYEPQTLYRGGYSVDWQEHIYNFQMLHFIGLEMNKWRTSRKH